MVSITQDMRYRLSIIKNMLNDMGALRLPSNIKLTASIFLAGKTAMTVRGTPCAIVPYVRPIRPHSYPNQHTPEKSG